MLLSGQNTSLSLAALLSARAERSGSRPFVVLGDRSLSFAEVERQASALAAALAGLGVDRGDRVALILPGSFEHVVGFFAIQRLGAVAVPLDPRLTGPELRYLLRHSEAVAAITVERWQGVDYLELFEGLLPHLPEFQYLVTVGEEDLWYDDRIFQFEDLLSSGQGRVFDPPVLDPQSDLAVLLYTSGTSGKPKAVELTHESLRFTAAATVDALTITEDDRVIGITALHHVFALGPGLVGSLLAGNALILQEAFDPHRSLEAIETQGATVQLGVPTVYVSQLQAQRERPRDLSTLRLGLVAGAPISDELQVDVETHLCPILVAAYSLSETASVLSVARPTDPEVKRRQTVGRPLDGMEVVVLEDGGVVLPVESLGEIAVRGPGLMRGYYRQPNETRRSMTSDGYFRTGDLGMLDEDGFIHLVGRQRDVIIRGGSNVHPSEVEDRLHQHPAVEDVGVVGIRDGLLGEAICAAVIVVEGAIVTEEELRDWCRAALAEHKVPDIVRFIDALPMTGTGKIRRVELARRMERSS